MAVWRALDGKADHHRPCAKVGHCPRCRRAETPRSLSCPNKGVRKMRKALLISSFILVTMTSAGAQAPWPPSPNAVPAASTPAAKPPPKPAAKPAPTPAAKPAAAKPAAAKPAAKPRAQQQPARQPTRRQEPVTPPPSVAPPPTAPPTPQQPPGFGGFIPG
jgi:hypothetical protein